MNSILEAAYTLLYIVYSYCEAVFRLVVPPSPKSVSGQVVLVTGGGKGIGRETALQLASRGATIVLWDIDKESLRSTAADLEAQGKVVHTYICDVSDYDDVTKTAAYVRRDVGDVDILVNNAGIMVCKELTDLTEGDVRRTLGINTLAHFWTIKAFLPAMMTNDKGHIVTISSYAGLGGTPLLTDYTASKFAVRGMAEALERELREKKLSGIALTTVYPLFTNTGLVSNVKDHALPRMRFGKLLEPEEVATAIADGILRNKREVFIPGDGTLLPFIIGALPNKGRQALTDFIDLRFTSTKS